MNDSVRRRQRFESFERACLLLQSALDSRHPEELNDLELEGVIQRFEHAFELGA